MKWGGDFVRIEAEDGLEMRVVVVFCLSHFSNISSGTESDGWVIRSGFGVVLVWPRLRCVPIISCHVMVPFVINLLLTAVSGGYGNARRRGTGPRATFQEQGSRVSIQNRAARWLTKRA